MVLKFDTKAGDHAKTGIHNNVLTSRCRASTDDNGLSTSVDRTADISVHDVKINDNSNLKLYSRSHKCVDHGLNHRRDSNTCLRSNLIVVVGKADRSRGNLLKDGHASGIGVHNNKVGPPNEPLKLETVVTKIAI